MEDDENQTLASLEDLDLKEEEEIKDNDESTSAESLPSLTEVEVIIGYRFNDKSLLQQAFTHSSHLHPQDDKCLSYQRLEYMGDSVLNTVITTHHYCSYSDLPPGILTPLRAANVDTEKLGRAALNHNLHIYLRHENPNLAQRIQEFKIEILDFPVHSYGKVRSVKVLADIVESTVGAVYVDSKNSIDTAAKVVNKLLQPMITPTELDQNAVSKLNTLCQKKGYKLTIQDGLKETKEVEIFVDDELVGIGKAQKKQVARFLAADMAYKELTNN